MALVLEPARDLAEQTHEALRAFARRLSAPALRTALAVGGGSGKDTLRALEAGVDVVTGTPGGLPRTAAAARAAYSVGKRTRPSFRQAMRIMRAFAGGVCDGIIFQQSSLTECRLLPRGGGLMC